MLISNQRWNNLWPGNNPYNRRNRLPKRQTNKIRGDNFVLVPDANPEAGALHPDQLRQEWRHGLLPQDGLLVDKSGGEFTECAESPRVLFQGKVICVLGGEGI